eukprot:gene22693-62301_t
MLRLSVVDLWLILLEVFHHWSREAKLYSVVKAGGEPRQRRVADSPAAGAATGPASAWSVGGRPPATGASQRRRTADAVRTADRRRADDEVAARLRGVEEELRELRARIDLAAAAGDGPAT